MKKLSMIALLCGIIVFPIAEGNAKRNIPFKYKGMDEIADLKHSRTVNVVITSVKTIVSAAIIYNVYYFLKFPDREDTW
ncbi:MAG: hypothetical protein Pg6B_09770 [Candidatus Azobacteroides pseudotrichonymphae]|jgi:hypothetical protein|nr:MAG: hypothetical protein Pg6B_09770 [Candidatus Azobacteroides pseudotrichonymphae]